MPQNATLRSYIERTGAWPVLSSQEEFELAVRVRTHADPEAARRLVLSNLRFVVKVAFQFGSYGVDPLDLIQEGNIGLMKAVEKFDPHRGNRLISYAVWWIRAYMWQYIMKNWSLVKIGTTQTQKKLFYKIGRIRAMLPPGVGDRIGAYKCLAHELEVSEKDVVEIEQRMSARDASLDRTVGSGFYSTPLESVSDDRMDQEEILSNTEENTSLKNRIREAMKHLSHKERVVVEKRLLTENRIPLREIGEELNLSKERVRQIEQRALSHLRKSLDDGAPLPPWTA